MVPSAAHLGGVRSTASRFDRWASSYEDSALQQYLFGPVHQTALQLAVRLLPQARLRSHADRARHHAGRPPHGRHRPRPYPLVQAPRRPGHRSTPATSTECEPPHTTAPAPLTRRRYAARLSAGPSRRHPLRRVTRPIMRSRTIVVSMVSVVTGRSAVRWFWIRVTAGRCSPGATAARRRPTKRSRPRPATLVTLRVRTATLRHNLLADCWQTTRRRVAGDALCLVELRGLNP
jgi:hypothetical protein